MKKILYMILIVTGLLISAGNSSAFYWEKVKSIPSPYNSNYWLDIYFLPSNPQYGWVCGFQGMVIRTTDGGANWQGSVVPNADHLESVTFTSPTVGYTSGVSGIFKSIDGGASWTDVTPTGATDLWGNYFVDDNNGLVLGGGCGNSQNFWKTTDGGASWTLFQGSEPNSGLTDLLLYSPTGLGYAVSSGRLWQTTDGGVTWTVFANSGSNVWQEELTRYNSSFLVPFAGTICTGGGSDGGMRFSVDNGSSWREFSTGMPMFGAFLVSDVSGWACGYDRQVWYTNDAGQSWQERNCGIENGHLDDMWFITPFNGWVVGEGVYKLAQDTIKMSKDVIDFGKACIPYEKTDTVWLKNYSFLITNAHAEILEDPEVAYSIVEPTSSDFTAQACDSVRLIIRFRPQRSGTITARLAVTVGANTLSVTLTGAGVAPTAMPADTLLEINPAAVGVATTGSIVWKSVLDNEYISEVQYAEGDKNISGKNILPIRITASGTNLAFNAIVRDTGWTSARFRVHLLPCDNDTFVTVRVYGVSPIITAEKDHNMLLECSNSRLDTIPVRNTGNWQLVIRSAQFLDAASGFSVAGWTSKKTIPIYINPGSADSIIIRFAPPLSATYNTILRIINNDSTTVDGRKNPYDINFSGTLTYSDIGSKDTLIDLGEICTGQKAEKPLVIRNKGRLNTEVTFRSLRGMFYSLSCGNKATIKGNDSVVCSVSFTPANTGLFYDTLLVENVACGQQIMVIIRAKAISGEISAAPSSISVILKSGKSFTQKITVTDKGTEIVRITSIKPVPGINDWSYTVSPALPVDLNPGQSMDFDITFTAGTTPNYSGTLCITAESKCPSEKCIPLDLIENDKSLAWTKNSIDFGLIRCSFNPVVDSLYIINTGTVADSITSLAIVPDESSFRIVNKPSLPWRLAPAESLSVVVEYRQPLEGSYNASLVFESGSTSGTPVSIPLSGEFKSVAISPVDTTLDFGQVEYCHDILEIKINIQNSGLLDEYLALDKTSLPAGFYTLPDDTLAVANLGSSELTVYFDPALTGGVRGVFNGKILLKGTNCPGIYTINVKAEIISPELTTSPDPMDFGFVLSGDKKPGSVIITNNGIIDQKITGIEVKNFKADYTLSLPALPRTLRPGESISVNIEFSADNTGIYNDSLVISHETECKYTDYSMLMAEVPSESYQVVLSAGDYRRAPGDSLSIALSLSQAIPRAGATRIDYEFGFDRRLFSPQIVTAKSNGGFVEIPFKYDYNSISGFISEDIASGLLSDSGTIINIDGIALSSIPDSTPVIIKKFDVASARPLNITKDDGSLVVDRFCRSEVAARLKFMPGFSATLNSQVVGGHSLGIAINSTGSQSVKAIITDMLGNRLLVRDNVIGTGNTMLIINLDAIPGGMYNITLISEYSKVWHEKFIKSE